MNVQKITDTNFQARKILTTQRYYKVHNIPKTEVIEVFELNQIKDKDFVRKCACILNKNLTRNLPALQKQLKSFFNDFLETKLWGSKDYYLAIKDSQTILGGMATTPYANTVHITQAFADYPKSSNIDNIFYAVLNNTQGLYPNYSITTHNYIKDCNPYITGEEIGSLKRNIRTKHTGTIYDIHKKNNFDLEEILDIKDFETDLLL